MRAVLIGVIVVIVGAACGHHDSDAPPATTDERAREQARFDAERQPEKVVAALGIGPGSRVADIGAGPGLMTVALARAVAPNGRVVATDIDNAVLDLLVQRVKSTGLGGVVEPRVAAADTPGLEAGAYDAILLAEVDHFFSDPVAWLHAATAALKPGGRIVIENRIYHRAQSLAAAHKAGLVLRVETTPVPGHFIAVFVAGDAK